MISVSVDENQLNSIILDEVKKKMSELEHSHTFWDTAELKRRTCMSWGTIQDTFFHDKGFPKAKVGGKWYFPAKEVNEFLIDWLGRQAQ